MTAFIVRVIEDHEFVGIVSCDCPDSIFWIVDEFCDPHQCEFAEMPDGMLFARDGAPKVRDDLGDDTEKDENFLGGAALCEEWTGSLLGCAESRWLPVGSEHSTGPGVPASVAALDTWISAQEDDAPTRPEAIRRLVERGLAG